MGVTEQYAAIVRFFAHFAARSARWVRSSPYLVGVAAVASVAITLVPLLRPLLQNADAALYNDQIEARTIGVRTTHIGYLTLGVLFRAVLPGDTDLVMNTLTLTMACVGLYAVYCSAYKLSSSILGSLLAVGAVAANHAYLRGSVLSEVDVPLAALVATAYALMLHSRTVWSAVAYGCAMLISPLGAVALPAFVVPTAFARQQRLVFRDEFKRILLFAGVSLLLYGTVVLFHWQDYVHGGRGILHAPRKSFSLAVQFARSYVFYRDECGFVTLLFALGLAAAIYRGLYGVVLGQLLAVATALLGERFIDVPVQLPAALLLASCVAVIPAVSADWPRRLETSWRWGSALAVAGVLLVTRATTSASVEAEVNEREAERTVYQKLAASLKLPVVLANVSGFDEVNRVERMVFGSTHTGRALSARDFKRRCLDIARAADDVAIWFLRAPWSAPCPALAERYQVIRRNIDGRRFAVLVPRNVPQ